MADYQRVFEYPEQVLIELYHWLNPSLQKILDSSLEKFEKIEINQIMGVFASNIIDSGIKFELGHKFE